MKISLCMIVKNEEKNIKRCIDSALNIVDETIIVDTGSADRTLDIIRSYGSKLKLIEYKWENDFAKARNIYLDHCTGDWILVLDGDEELICDSNRFYEKLSSTKAESFNLHWLNQLDNNSEMDSFAYNRIFKNSGYKYYRAVHEQLNIDEAKIETLSDDICKIFHYGYTNENVKGKNKIDRNLNILIKEYNKNPGDPFVSYHLGATYAASGDYKNALVYFAQSYELGLAKGFGAYHFELVKRMSQCIYLLKDYWLCIDFIMDLLKQSKLEKYTDLYYIAGCSFYQLKDYKCAENFFVKCIELGERSDYPTFFGRGSFLAELMLARVYNDAGNTDMCKKFYLKVLEKKKLLNEQDFREVTEYTKNMN